MSHILPRGGCSWASAINRVGNDEYQAATCFLIELDESFGQKGKSFGKRKARCNEGAVSLKLAPYQASSFSVAAPTVSY